MLEGRDSYFDRRIVEDRRNIYELDYFLKGGIERRTWEERRSPVERRSGWLRVSKWVSVSCDEIGIGT